MARKSIDFEKMIGKAERPGGMVAHTPNGTSKGMGTGWNKREPYSSAQLPPDKTRPAGRSNRTGE